MPLRVGSSPKMMTPQRGYSEHEMPLPQTIEIDSPDHMNLT